MTRLALNILLFLQVGDLWIYTESETEGVIMDPCKGDSGGPLIIDNGGQPLLVGVLQVPLTGCFYDENFTSTQGDGYDCATNLTSGDGSWSNVVTQREWVLGHITGSIAGELCSDGWFNKYVWMGGLICLYV